MQFGDLQVLVLGCARKKNLTVEWLDQEGIEYKLYQNPDWDYIESDHKLHPESFRICTSKTGQYRCFKGQQMVFKEYVTDTSPEFILMFEDDAVVRFPEWKEIVLECVNLLSAYEVIGLCNWGIYPGLNFDFDRLMLRKPGVLHGFKWWNGSAALLFTKSAAIKLMETPYIGVPLDIWIANYLESCCLDQIQQPFVHISEGSLIAGTC